MTSARAAGEGCQGLSSGRGGVEGAVAPTGP